MHEERGSRALALVASIQRPAIHGLCAKGYVRRLRGPHGLSRNLRKHRCAKGLDLHRAPLLQEAQRSMASCQCCSEPCPRSHERGVKRGRFDGAKREIYNESSRKRSSQGKDIWKTLDLADNLRTWRTKRRVSIICSKLFKQAELSLTYGQVPWCNQKRTTEH